VSQRSSLTYFGLRLTVSGFQDADLGSTGMVLNLQKTLITWVMADRLLQPWLKADRWATGI
jgi:hypothetical protein